LTHWKALSDFPDLPPAHRTLLKRLKSLQSDKRIVGIAAGGSIVTGLVDQFSDLDVLVAVDPDAYPEVLQQRPAIAATLGKIRSSILGVDLFHRPEDCAGRIIRGHKLSFVLAVQRAWTPWLGT
jgi:predicted nucleotidyltransferase